MGSIIFRGPFDAEVLEKFFHPLFAGEYRILKASNVSNADD